MSPDASFGRWLQGRRKALGLTQAELGAQVGASAAAIRKIEADERRPSTDIAVRLAQHFAVPSDQQAAFVRFARGESSAAPADIPLSHSDDAPWRSGAPSITSLPIPSTLLIGRAHEVAAICELLSQSEARLITLTGPGGTGKTRLALAVADEVADHFRDGVVLVALAPLATADLVLPAIAQALGVRETGGQPLLMSVQMFLRDKQLLLILDNFEHLLGAATVVSDLLGAAAQLKILVTSREVLHLSGEYDVPIPPLPVPDIHCDTDHAKLMHYDSVRLFLQRAQAVNPHARLTGENLEAVAEICVRLDGLPLAIELAAARCKLLSPQQIVARLEDRFALLTHGARDLPARQQTIRNTIDWSYLLLSAEEQRLFSRLSVFAGGWTLEAAEAVCGDNGLNVLEGLQSLIDKSLVQQTTQPDGEPRFSMLETIREYAWGRLGAQAELDEVRSRHVAYFRRVVEAAESHLHGAEEGRWSDRLDREHDNLRTALQWAIERENSESGLCLAGILGKFWISRNLHTEGYQWLTRVIALPRLGVAIPIIARALVWTGWLGINCGAYRAASAAFEEALSIGQDTGSDSTIASALVGLGRVAQMECDFRAARTFYEECLVVSRRITGHFDIALTLNLLGETELSQGHVELARGYCEESLTMAQNLSATYLVRWALGTLGRIAHYRGDLVEAQRFYMDSLAISRELGDRESVVGSLVAIAEIAILNADLAAARKALEESLAINVSTSSSWGLGVSRRYLGYLALRDHEYDKAVALLQESLSSAFAMGHQEDIVEVLERIAIAILKLSRAAVATRLFSLASSIRERLGTPIPIYQREEYERLVASLRAHLGSHMFTLEWQAGQEMTLDQAINLARTPLDESVESSVFLRAQSVPPLHDAFKQ